LLANDDAGAARAAAAVTDDATRARLQAALLPLPQRPAALLAVARAFPNAPAADATLRACAAAVLLLQQRRQLVPDLAELCEELHDELPGGWRGPEVDRRALGEVVVELQALLSQRSGAGGDPTARAEARRLLHLCALTFDDRDGLRVLPATPLPVPRPLAEDLVLRVRRAGDAPPQLDQDLLERDAEFVHLLPMTNTPAVLPPLPAGQWLLELASTSTPWRALQAVEVSDLWAIGFGDDDWIAFGGGRLDPHPDPSAGTAVALDGEREVGRVAFDGACAGLVPAPTRAHSAPVRLLLVADGEPCTLDWSELRHWGSAPAGEFTAHVMVDQPLHRPGETVRGRALLRHVVRTGEGLAATVDTSVAAGCAVQLCVLPKTPHERRIDGRTDAHGTFAFECALPETYVGEVTLALSARADEAHEWQAVAQCRPTAAAWYRRPAITIGVDGPTRVERAPPDGIVEVAVHAHWASGGPAADVAVAADVWASGEHEERHLRTGADGTARLPIDVRRLDAGTVTVRCTVDAIDGNRTTVRHVFEFGPQRPVRATAAWGERPWLECADEAAVDDDVCVTVHADANARLLAVAGRGPFARAETLRCDEDGEARWHVLVAGSDWPALDLAVGDGQSIATRQVPVRHSWRQPRITLPEQAAPGAQLTCRVATAPFAVVTLAVVDERLFALRADSTREPTAALRPDVMHAEWRQVRSRQPCGPALVLARLLRDGKVVPPDDPLRPASLPGAGGPAGAGEGATDVRTDFRAAAAFVTVVADAAGTAELSFALPDDLTTWRATIVGVAPIGDGFLERRAIEARLPLAAEPLLPRVLRAGDRVELPVAIDRAATAGGPDATEFTVAASSAQIAVGAHGDGMSGTCAVRPGRTGTVFVPVEARADGTAALSIEVACGERRDASRRDVAVGRDAIERTEWRSGAGADRATVELPAATVGEDDRIDVEVFAGGAAAARELGRRLEDYPHGCVEQTLSRLLPFAAAVRAARRHGEPLPQSTPQVRQRIAMGIARLRMLQEGQGGAFAWWPGGGVDLGMSGLVLHGLAALRDAGIDPAAHGLGIDAAAGAWVVALRRLRAQAGIVRGADDVAAAEAVAGLLYFACGDVTVREVAAMVADAPQLLPQGMLTRLGLAFAAAGDRARAQRCRDRADAAERAAIARAGFPGESPLAVAALRLELELALGAEAAAQAPRIEHLLRTMLAGQCRTYDDGVALLALALALPPGGAEPRTAQVVCGDAQREVALDAAHAFAAGLRLPRGGRVEAVSPGQFLLLRAGVRRSERASDHAAWAAPLRVQRTLLRPQAEGDPVAVTGSVRAGEPLLVRLEVETSVPLAYAVLECPLPAGFELLAEPRWLARSEAGVAATVDWVEAGRTAVREFQCAATLCGRVAWPPVQAAGMYDDSNAGGTAGSWVVVEPAAAGAAIAVAPCFANLRARAPVAPLAPRQDTAQLAVDAMLLQRELAFGSARGVAVHGVAANGAAAGEVARQRIDAALSQLQQLVESAPADVLRSTAVTLSDVTQRIGAMPPEWLEAAARRLADVRAAAAAALLERCRVPASPTWGTGGLFEYIGLLVDELEAMAPARREPFAVRLLPLVRRDMPWRINDVIWALDRSATIPELRAQLRALLDGPCGPAAFLALPDADVAALPPAVLARWLGDDGDGGGRAVQLLLQSEAGRAELRRHPEAVAIQELDYDRFRVLPDVVFADAPLAVLGRLADGEPDRAVALLAASAVGTDVLQRELAAPSGAVPEGVLAQVLRRRSARDLGTVDLDGGGRMWAAWLAAAADAQRFDELARAAAAADLRLARGDLIDSVGPLFAERATAAQLAAAPAWVRDEDWPRALLRLDRPGILAVLQATTAAIEVAPTDDAVVARALLEHAIEHGNLAAVVDTLATTAAGAGAVRERLPTLAERDQQPARAAFADRLDLDYDTLEPATEVTVERALRVARTHGFGGEWPAELRPLRARLLSLRGIGP